MWLITSLNLQGNAITLTHLYMYIASQNNNKSYPNYQHGGSMLFLTSMNIQGNPITQSNPYIVNQNTNSISAINIVVTNAHR